MPQKCWARKPPDAKTKRAPSRTCGIGWRNNLPSEICHLQSSAAWRPGCLLAICLAKISFVFGEGFNKCSEHSNPHISSAGTG
jgi:hypothetical protein